MELQGQKDWTRQFENGPGQNGVQVTGGIQEIGEKQESKSIPPLRKDITHFAQTCPSSPLCP